MLNTLQSFLISYHFLIVLDQTVSTGIALPVQQKKRWRHCHPELLWVGGGPTFSFAAPGCIPAAWRFPTKNWALGTSSKGYQIGFYTQLIHEPGTGCVVSKQKTIWNHRSCRSHRVGAVTRRQSIVSLVLWALHGIAQQIGKTLKPPPSYI